MNLKPRRTAYAVPGKERIDSPGFLGLWFTQWLTAIDDNAFRWLVVGIAKDFFPPADHTTILTVGLASFVLPYLLLAAPAGYLADRFGKRDVILVGKGVEWLTLALGMVAIRWGNLPLLFVVVGLMGCQSALFAPAKMGLLPEMMSAERIAAANGWFGLSTVTATMVGMGLGGLLADIMAPQGSRHLGAAIAVLMGSATLGIVSASIIPRYAPADPRRRFPWNAVGETIRDLRTLYARRSLFLMALGIVFFWSIAAIAQLNIDQIAYEAGAFFESERTPLLLSLVLGVGVGCVLAGVLSRGRIELGLLAPALVAMALFSILLVAPDRPFFNVPLEPLVIGGLQIPWNGDLFRAMGLLFALGVAAGVFDVPLAAYLQHRSPADKRGAILSAANFCIFSGVLLSALLFLTLRTPFHPGARHRVFEALEPIDAIAVHEIDLEATRWGETWRRGERPSLESVLDVAASESTGGAAEPSDLSHDDTAASDASASIAGDDSGADSIAVENAVAGESSSPLLAHRYAALLWEEVAARRALKEKPVPVEYYERFARPELRTITKEVFRESGRLPLLSARQVFLLIGLVTLPIALLVFRGIPQATLRFLVGNLLRLAGLARIPGRPPLPETQVVVLVANRFGSLGRMLLHVTVGRPLIEVRWETGSRRGWGPVWDRWWGVIRIAGGPSAVQEGLIRARRTVLNGGTLVIPPRTVRVPGRGAVTGDDAYPDEVERIVEGIKVPWVPLFVDEPPAAARARTFLGRLWAARCRPLTIRFGEPRPWTSRETGELRRWVHEIGSGLMSGTTNDGADPSDLLMPAAAFLRRCREAGKRKKIADSTGADCTGDDLLLRTLILRRLLRRHVLDDSDRFVALLLPPSVPSVIANMAMAIDRRIVVNLNYTLPAETLEACLKLCGIRKVITSRRVVDKLGLKLSAEMVMLEDLRPKVTWQDKLFGFIDARLRSIRSLERRLGLDRVKPEDPLTVIFTSGSTGVPKGVVLSQRNIATNVRAIRDVIRLDKNDVMVGALPFFHSFGYTVTLWGTMNLDLFAVYHFSPLDSKIVGRLAKHFGATVLLATPTFLRGYLKRCLPDEFSKLEIVVAGAEKLPTDLSDEFERKFGCRPVEGYGATELSPLVSVNVPPARDPNDGRVLRREGSVGLPIPGVRIRIEDVDSGAVLGPNRPGMLWVSGPNVMQGYLHRRDLTDEVLVDGWYRTGDIAYVDDDGFIHITGRVSRFSKIGGEMVPHIQIEEELARIIDERLAREGRSDQADGYVVAVSAVPDERKGERLVVLYVPLGIEPETMRTGLQEAGLPALYIPSADSFVPVEKIPILGSGKLDLKGLQQTAAEKVTAG